MWNRDIMTINTIIFLFVILLLIALIFYCKSLREGIRASQGGLRLNVGIVENVENMMDELLRGIIKGKKDN